MLRSELVSDQLAMFFPVASDRLADAEASAERDRKKAVKENHHSGNLPPGTEFALCHAEAQLMSAVYFAVSRAPVV